jgi:uncharacterized protein (TIGR00251 family)
MAVKLSEVTGGVRIAIKVVPGASRDRIVGVLGDSLKVAVSKPPAGGAANAAVVKLLAEALGVPAGHVTIVRGQTNPRKEVQIEGISAAELANRIDELLANR